MNRLKKRDAWLLSNQMWDSYIINSQDKVFKKMDGDSEMNTDLEMGIWPEEQTKWSFNLRKINQIHST